MNKKFLLKKRRTLSKSSKTQKNDQFKKAQATMEVLIIMGVLVVGVIIFGTFYFGNIGERSRGVSGTPGDLNDTELKNSYDKALIYDGVEQVSMDGGSSHINSGGNDDGDTPVCDNDGNCESGETTENCPTDCLDESDLTILVFDTTEVSTGSSANNQIKLPLEATGTYNFNVDWNDGSPHSNITSWNQAQVTHTYVTEGIYEIKLDGIIYGFNFHYDPRDPATDSLKLLEIKNWGNLNLGNNGNYFFGCSNLDVTATDVLDLNGTTNLYGLFNGCNSLVFNESINSWNTSSVTNMSSMFYGASDFNQSLSFDTSNVTNMSSMFYGASDFNQSLSFDTSNVTNMSSMFSGASDFNQSLSFDTSSVTNMSGMFSGASDFNQSLSFDTSNVTNMSSMFARASSFNQSLSFDTSNVTDMARMFSGASDFNQSLSFDTSNVTNMSSMFARASSFNQSLSFDTSSVTYMRSMFYDASSFDQNISSWNVDNVTDWTQIFENCPIQTSNKPSRFR